jgi:peptide-methionine (S)-S-oxide reductase
LNPAVGGAGDRGQRRAARGVELPWPAVQDPPAATDLERTMRSPAPFPSTLLLVPAVLLLWSCGETPPAAAAPGTAVAPAAPAPADAPARTGERAPAAAAPASRPLPPGVVLPPKPAVDLPPAAPGTQRTAVLAGGCFWCEEGVFEQLAGVSKVVSGYAGGTAETATYERYHESNHAEAVQITYDPAVISYGDLLRVLFTAGDPTTPEGQEPDYGHGYRMAVFYQDDDQRRVAEAYIRQLGDAHVYAAPIAVTVEPMPLGFFPAEDYHQRFVALHPDHPYVCRWSLTKIARVRAALSTLVKPAEQTPPNR